MDASSSNRQELIRNAVLFLNDSKVSSSSLTSRIQFLESKGLSEGEIQQALSQASGQTHGHEPSPYGSPPERPSGPPSFSPADYGYPQRPRYDYGYGTRGTNAPEPPKRDWRDLFIMAVISGGVVYGLSTLARKYLLPHLQPPSTTSFQDTSSSLAEGYDEASRLLNELSEQTTKLQTSVEGDRERVNAVVGEVEDALKSVRDGEERWREEMRDIRGEVESVRELVPKMIEKHAQSQRAALTDLQAELLSLKTLLVSRQNIPSVHTPTLSSPSPAAQQASSAQAQSNGIAGISQTTNAANALLTPRGKGIPAWQLPSPSPDTGAGDKGKGKEKEKESDKEVAENGA